MAKSLNLTQVYRPWAYDLRCRFLEASAEASLHIRTSQGKRRMEKEGIAPATTTTTSCQVSKHSPRSDRVLAWCSSATKSRETSHPRRSCVNPSEVHRRRVTGTSSNRGAANARNTRRRPGTGRRHGLRRTRIRPEIPVIPGRKVEVRSTRRHHDGTTDTHSPKAQDRSEHSQTSRRLVITMPEGMTMNPSAAAGWKRARPNSPAKDSESAFESLNLHRVVSASSVRSNLEVPTLPAGSLTGRCTSAGRRGKRSRSRPAVHHVSGRASRRATASPCSSKARPRRTRRRVSLTTTFAKTRRRRSTT